MEISEELTCLFSAQIKEEEHSYVIKVPRNEIASGYVDPTGVYQVALISAVDNNPMSAEEEIEPETDPDQPPVAEDETRIVEIEDVGDQGDGLTRVDRGYVVIVPGAEKGERVEIEIETVRENVAFARVIDRLDYYE